MTTCFVVLEWKDGKTRDPIAVCATRQQAEAMINAFRDIEEVPFNTEPDEPHFLGTVEWKGWKVDLYDGDDDE